MELLDNSNPIEEPALPKKGNKISVSLLEKEPQKTKKESKKAASKESMRSSKKSIKVDIKSDSRHRYPS